MDILIKTAIFALCQLILLHSSIPKYCGYNLPKKTISSKYCKLLKANKILEYPQGNGIGSINSNLLSGYFLLEVGKNQYDTYNNMNDDTSSSIYYIGNKKPVYVDSLFVQNNIKKRVYQELVTPWQIMGDEKYDGKLEVIIKQIIKTDVRRSRSELLNPYNNALGRCEKEYRKYVLMKRHIFLLVKGNIYAYNLGKFDYMENHIVKQKSIMVYFSGNNNCFSCETMNII
jgi:hypothetical protein